MEVGSGSRFEVDNKENDDSLRDAEGSPSLLSIYNRVFLCETERILKDSGRRLEGETVYTCIGVRLGRVPFEEDHACR